MSDGVKIASGASGPSREDELQAAVRYAKEQAFWPVPQEQRSDEPENGLHSDGEPYTVRRR